MAHVVSPRFAYQMFIIKSCRHACFSRPISRMWLKSKTKMRTLCVCKFSQMLLNLGIFHELLEIFGKCWVLCGCFYTGCAQKIHQLSVIVEKQWVWHFHFWAHRHVGFFNGWTKIGAMSPIVATEMVSCGATMHVLCQCPEDEVRKYWIINKTANPLLLGLSWVVRSWLSTAMFGNGKANYLLWEWSPCRSPKSALEEHRLPNSCSHSTQGLDFTLLETDLRF